MAFAIKGFIIDEHPCEIVPLPGRFPACNLEESLYNSEHMEESTKARFHFNKVPWKGGVFLAVGLLIAGWLFKTPPGLLGKADAIAYAVCHRIAARSFYLGDRQLPLCARCTGMYLGAMLGLVYQSALGRRRGGLPSWRVLAVLGLFVVAFGVDGINSYLHLFPGAPSLYEPQNWLRLITGSGMGLAIAVVLLPAFNQTVWQDWDARPAMDGLRPLGGLILLAAGLDLVVLTQNPFALYPLALISAAGVLVLLTMIYTMVFLMIFRQENRFLALSKLVFPLTGGFGFALLQITLLDAARFILTGTWAGFHLG